MWYQGGPCAHRSRGGVVVACASGSGACAGLQQEEGVRAGQLPRRHTFSLPVLRGSLGGRGEGREEGRGKHLLSGAGLAAGLSWCGWTGLVLGLAGSGRDLLQAWLRMASDKCWSCPLGTWRPGKRVVGQGAWVRSFPWGRCGATPSLGLKPEAGRRWKPVARPRAPLQLWDEKPLKAGPLGRCPGASPSLAAWAWRQ